MKNYHLTLFLAVINAVTAIGFAIAGDSAGIIAFANATGAWICCALAEHKNHKLCALTAEQLLQEPELRRLRDELSLAESYMGRMGVHMADLKMADRDQKRRAS